MTITTFDEIIDNPRIFKMILDEVLHDWPGSYDIMPVESPQDRKIKEHENKFADFCLKVRESTEGIRRCMDCDLEYSKIAEESKKPLYYSCHAGLMEIAVPIMVGGKLVATIFCGQHRSLDIDLEKRAIEKTNQTEIDLGYEPGELLKLREKAHIISYDRVRDIEEKLGEVATYVSTLGLRKLEAEQAKKELSIRLRETNAIQKLLFELSDVLDNLDDFWQRLDVVIKKICEIIGANIGLFIDFDGQIMNEKKSGIVRSIANLPNNFKGKVMKCEAYIGNALVTMHPSVHEISIDQAKDTFADVRERFIEQDAPYKLAIVPIKLEPNRVGAMLFVLSKYKDTSSSLNIADELSLLTQAGTHISTAYGNCLLYQKQKILAEFQSGWLEDVSHQILAPITGILGQTENLSKHFRDWQKASPQRIDNSLITLTELAEWATRMAKNFAWVANDHNHPRELSFRLEDDVPGKFIGYARNVQGFAKTRGITRVHVDSESVKQLNNRIVIDNKLFKQAVANLLDNAVKYANVKTEILIYANLTATQGHIHIADYGIPLLETEIDKIFNRYYRTEAAKQKYVIGSGIGLEIAREIIRLHSGELTASPSVRTPIGWKTTFVISLPLK